MNEYEVSEYDRGAFDQTQADLEIVRTFRREADYAVRSMRAYRTMAWMAVTVALLAIGSRFVW